MDSIKTWADGPFKLLSTPRASLEGEAESVASRNASEMALVHNILLRGLNCIYLQAPNVKETSDIADFMQFCDAWSSILHSHHAAEETVYFKLLDEQSARDDVFTANHTEHERFLPGLFAFDLYVSGVRDNANSYDGQRVRELIDAFGTDLETHLHHEIALLEDLATDGLIDWDQCGKAMAQYSKKHADRRPSRHPALTDRAFLQPGQRAGRRAALWIRHHVQVAITIDGARGAPQLHRPHDQADHPQHEEDERAEDHDAGEQLPLRDQPEHQDQEGHAEGGRDDPVGKIPWDPE
ncbi:hypothetical protein DSL72_000750 [Monilinia vaccinii-corymbosi]|uniref:Hemerythrin-like domain-containing protein n=1 Tax=Monilinia vaccinii-corymbosi TaxID=61207 RepID=A0A8A3PAE7_9HELO|nr:hypothetical protein DSL72_000750 [Monilinia vaccinii-corymbosi]